MEFLEAGVFCVHPLCQSSLANVRRCCIANSITIVKEAKDRPMKGS